MGALPGLNSSSVEWVNSRGESSGISTDGRIDPLTGWPEAVAVIWKNGQIISLGTLGGNESLATAINDRGQVVGMAANGVTESVSFAALELPGYGTQQRAFLWQRGVMTDLGTLGGPAAAAFFINERSQVVGMSYSDSNPNPGTGLPTLAPFLWQNGTMINRSEVVGGSNLAGDATSHPFLWSRGVLKDLGTLGGTNGGAASINDAGEIAGTADLPGDEVHHAALWKNEAIEASARLQAIRVVSLLRSTQRGRLWEDRRTAKHFCTRFCGRTAVP
jgi:probable HAF family extracellular repeat protein